MKKYKLIKQYPDSLTWNEDDLCDYWKPELITNSESKQEGIIKEIIY